MGWLHLGWLGALLALLAAAFLEVGGDALVRRGLNAGFAWPRFGLIGQVDWFCCCTDWR